MSLDEAREADPTMQITLWNFRFERDGRIKSRCTGRFYPRGSEMKKLGVNDNGQLCLLKNDFSLKSLWDIRMSKAFFLKILVVMLIRL